MAVDRTWRTPDRRWLVDQVVDESGVQYRVWEAEGAPAGALADYAALGRLLAAYGITPDQLVQVLTEDPWCK